jgi:CMP-N,N'-diacetyllegionaminic acid synthase|tara:strand:+ start:2588 stop:3280 length:693 start_codon:yes stop_codon:yes gene_type:complete
MKKKNIHAIILARGGSKGIKNKNLITLNKKPLIYWSINSFLKNKYVKKIWVSSDDKEILTISKKFGANIILRPKKLSNDIASSDHAWVHAIKTILKKEEIEYVIGVQPTSPIRDDDDINNSINKFFKYKYDSLFTASDENEGFLWSLNKKKIIPSYNILKRPRRQDLRPKICENGSFYIFNVKKFLKYENRLFDKIGYYKMQKYKGYQIDSWEDFLLIDTIIKNRAKFKF